MRRNSSPSAYAASRMKPVVVSVVASNASPDCTRAPSCAVATRMASNEARMTIWRTLSAHRPRIEPALLLAALGRYIVDVDQPAPDRPQRAELGEDHRDEQRAVRVAHAR